MAINFDDLEKYEAFPQGEFLLKKFSGCWDSEGGSVKKYSDEKYKISVKFRANILCLIITPLFATFLFKKILAQKLQKFSRWASRPTPPIFHNY